ncbi:DsbA family protein [Curtobacterium aurantiacum]|uniref:Thioredoxin domain-containing protein n=1 Tax=Curtobacterium aurantiacum TaxID=3236919 RepID=A0ABS5VG78_9MICO|nr:thioredoxin domain-containing protein [Curtobacterium flaccumfaciens]MBT1545757.1 thioredoxin domain-containing protein [Curtobacterium flaccumfaciens pv. flaccumfaciens]MBT1587720.1 thioredoxin domain-containing protein [Curtobacterium flaccumfaciens pv. flaccumfaciens]
MTNRPEGDARAARNARREAARQRAQRARTQQKRRQRGVRLGLQIGLGVVLLAAATIVTLVLVDSVKPAGPGPSTMSQGGITIGQDLKPVTAAASGSASASASPDSAATAGAGTVRITLYVDYLCPGCGQFEQANGDYIEDLVDSGAATVDIHPVAILSNRSQGTKYSLRAANAAACVAEHSPNQFYAVNQALFAKQPDEGTPGLTDAELTDVVTGVQGLTERSAVRSCIADQDYAKWVDEQTTAVSEGTIPGSTLKEFPGTPLVLVNGQRYELTSPVTNDDFRTFVVTAAGATDATPTPTPSATPSPTPTKR